MKLVATSNGWLAIIYAEAGKKTAETKSIALDFGYKTKQQQKWGEKTNTDWIDGWMKKHWSAVKLRFLHRLHEQFND